MRHLGFSKETFSKALCKRPQRCAFDGTSHKDAQQATPKRLFSEAY
jgi:hypothetical protein